MFCIDGLLKIIADDGFCVCFAVRHGLMSFVCFVVRHVSVSLYLMGLYQWVFFGKSSSGGSGFGRGFGCGYGYGHGIFFSFVFSWWWWICD